MKAILISIQQQHVKNICTIIGYENKKPIYKKTADIRKTCPKIKPPFKCYIYCTQGKYFLFKEQIGLGEFTSYKNVPETLTLWNQKIIGEFICDRIEEYPYKDFGYEISEKSFNATMLTGDEFCNYGKQKTLYGWHISDLKIYDKPKKLSEFKGYCKYKGMTEECWRKNGEFCNYSYEYITVVHHIKCEKVLTHPPQSWCYVEI